MTDDHDRHRAGAAVGRGRRLATLLLAVGVLMGGFPASAPAQGPAMPREAIETVVREYLLEHPEIVIEALQRAQAREREAAHKRAVEAVRAHRQELLQDPGSPVGGNPAASVTIVEFFDYRCPHCRRMAPILKTLLAEDPSVRVVFKDWPILGAESVVAARAALAAGAQGRYVEAHDRLMSEAGPLTVPRVVEVLEGLGLDEARLRREMDSPEVTATISRVHALAQALGIGGTPALVVGEELVLGAVDLDTLRQLVARARSVP